MIKILVMDVDGTLTDGKVYIGKDGELMKAFNIKDGLMISRLPKYGIVPIIITGRSSIITELRCKELGINEVYQGVSNKVEKLMEVIAKLGCNLKDVAYIGDDLIDIECMKICGISGCPSDAIQEIKEISMFISKQKGGEGAVREFIEWILK